MNCNGSIHCFQQGYNHPNPVSFIVGLVAIILVVMVVKRLFGGRK